jgi:hypothetical protein
MVFLAKRSKKSRASLAHFFDLFGGNQGILANFEAKETKECARRRGQRGAGP